jgi:hypothetical protein
MPDTTTIVPMDWAIMDLVRQDVEAMKKVGEWYAQAMMLNSRRPVSASIAYSVAISRLPVREGVGSSSSRRRHR